MPKAMATVSANAKPVIYIVDGKGSKVLQVASPCITIYISSPRNSDFDEWCKQKNYLEVSYFPVWSLAEILQCQSVCNLGVTVPVIEDRFTQYGGIARIVFASKSQPLSMEALISDANAEKSIEQIGKTSLTFPVSHKLLHIIAGEEPENQFQFLYLDIGSDFIGVQLFDKHFQKTIKRMRELLGVGGSLGGHLFQSYLHFTFKYSDKLTFPCRALGK